MENAIKALEIAAGVLLGVILMALIVYFFSSIGAFPQQQDELKTTEQLAAFNLEYEVYEKKGMYGTDVISCMTKAQSNNEKYAEGGYFLSGNRYGDEFYINVYVKINSSLEESLEVYHYNEYNKQVQSFASSSTFKMSDAGFAFASNDISQTYTTFKNNTQLISSTAKLEGSGYINPSDGPYGPNNAYNAQLYNLSNKSEVTPLQRLLKFASSNAKQVVYNRSGKDLDIWSSAIWKTALYSFKTKRFKCDEIQYSTITGRVNAICFSEID